MDVTIYLVSSSAQMRCDTRSAQCTRIERDPRFCECVCVLAYSGQNSWQLVTHAVRCTRKMMPCAASHRHFARVLWRSCVRLLCETGAEPREAAAPAGQACGFSAHTRRNSFAIYASSDVVTDLKWSCAKSRSRVAVTSTEKMRAFTRRLFRVIAEVAK